jgi:hypothetical protein
MYADLFNDGFIMSDYLSSNGRMIVINELKKMWTKVVVAYNLYYIWSLGDWEKTANHPTTTFSGTPNMHSFMCRIFLGMSVTDVEK